MKFPSALRLVSLGLCLAALLAGTPLAATEASEVTGRWYGAITLPGTELAFDVDLAVGEDGALTGDISIPAQGGVDIPLVDLALEGDELRFRISGVPGEPSFAGTPNEDGTEISGTFTQGGGNTTFSMSRDGSPAEAAADALEGFDEFVAKAVTDWNAPGAAVAVVSGNEVIFAEGFGMRDIDRQLPVTADTLFAIGSTTKAFTVTTLGTLADEGKLDWDKPVHSYIPEFRLSDPTISQRISARDLVTHRSGLPRHDLLWYNFNDGTRAELVARLADLEFSADLRERYQYNNLMFLTAGYLAERLTGNSWEEAVRDLILDPLGMKRTNFSVLDSQKDDDHALPYRENDDDELEAIPFRVADLVGPAGSINSSVREMSQWVLLNLHRGQLGDTKVVAPATLADIHAPHMVVGAPTTRPDISVATYAMGWVTDTYRGHRRVMHGGAIDGFTASVVLFPDDALGIVTLVNTGGPLTGLIPQHAADRVLGLEPVDWNAEALAQQEQGAAVEEEAKASKGDARIQGTTPSHALADYAGNYHHPSYGPLTVSLTDEVLTVRFNNIEAPLDHWHYDVFTGAATEGDPTFEDMRFQFRSDLNGTISSVEAPFEPAVSAIQFAKQPDARLTDPEYLQRFVGRYTLAGQTGAVTLNGNQLTLALPGQAPLTLVPQASGDFVLKEASIITVRFDQDDEGKVTAITILQPDGVYRAERVE